MSTNICQITKKEIPVEDGQNAELLNESIFKLIQNDYHDFTRESFISKEKLNEYRKSYLENLVKEEIGELNELEQEVIRSIANNKILSENIEPEIEGRLTTGQKIADKIAQFGGSWTFIITFFTFILIWMGINIIILSQRAFDPYPFILLNLILSCLAAIQAPIIMMSQNRREEKDRNRSEHDYKINLKAELEIKLLHEKIDHLLAHQNKRLLEIQEIQTDYLDDIAKQLKKLTEGK